MAETERDAEHDEAEPAAAQVLLEAMQDEGPLELFADRRAEHGDEARRRARPWVTPGTPAAGCRGRSVRSGHKGVDAATGWPIARPRLNSDQRDQPSQSSRATGLVPRNTVVGAVATPAQEVERSAPGRAAVSAIGQEPPPSGETASPTAFVVSPRASEQDPQEILRRVAGAQHDLEERVGLGSAEDHRSGVGRG